jgi:hypothetical protein
MQESFLSMLFFDVLVIAASARVVHELNEVLAEEKEEIHQRNYDKQTDIIAAVYVFVHQIYSIYDTCPFCLDREHEKREYLLIWEQYSKRKEHAEIEKYICCIAYCKACYDTAQNADEVINVEFEAAPFFFELHAHEPIEIQNKYNKQYPVIGRHKQEREDSPYLS